MRLTGHGIAAGLPRGWEGAIVTASPVDVRQSRFYSLRDDRWPPTATASAVESLPVLHLANFALPGARGDFGSGAVEVMGPADAFVSLLEYGRENVGTALFERVGIPGPLRPEDVHPRALQRALAGQAGYQQFFTEAGRAFCVYVVIGDRNHIPQRIAEVNAVLAAIEIEPRPS